MCETLTKYKTQKRLYYGDGPDAARRQKAGANASIRAPFAAFWRKNNQFRSESERQTLQAVSLWKQGWESGLGTEMVEGAPRMCLEKQPRA